MIKPHLIFFFFLFFLLTRNSPGMESETQKLIALQEDLLHHAQSMVTGRNARSGSRTRLKVELKGASPRKFANGVISEIDQQLLAELRRRGVTDELLQKHRELAVKQLETEYLERKKNCKPASSPFRNLAHKVQGLMDGPALEAVTQENEAHSASTDDYQIIINEQKLRAEYSQEAIAFIFAHEKQHANNRHNLNRRTIFNALTEIDGGKLTLASMRLYNKYMRRQEVEADLCPALKNPGFAAGYKSFAESLVTRCGKGKAVSHPRNTHRAQAAESAVNFMAEYAALHLSKKRKQHEEGFEHAAHTKIRNVNRNLFQELAEPNT